MAFETGGRLGRQSRDGLRKMAMQAAEAHGGLLTAAGLENRWRRNMEAALLFGVADALLLAMGGEQASDLARPAQDDSTPTPPTRTQSCVQARSSVQDVCTPCELEQEIEGIWMNDLGHQEPSGSLCLDADEEAADFLHGSQSVQPTTPSGQAAPSGSS